jgi:hypothetical protein
MTAYDVDDFAVLTLTVPEGTAGTAAAVTAWTRPDGIPASLPAAAPLDDEHTSWEAVTGQLDMAGEWTAEWTITGPGAAVEYHAVQVAPAPPVAARSYATTADLAAWLQAAPPAGSARLLARATEVVDGATVSAVYDVTGDDELPSDAGVAAAFRDAVCAQVEAWQANGTSHAGAGAAQWQTITAGRISLGRAGGSTAVPVNGGQLAEHAAGILRRAGLIGRPWMAW